VNVSQLNLRSEKFDDYDDDDDDNNNKKKKKKNKEPYLELQTYFAKY